MRLKRSNLRLIWYRLGIVMQRTVQELNGEPWLDLDEAEPMVKQVMSSRSFGQRVETLPELREARATMPPMQHSACASRACLPTLFRYLFRTAPLIRQSSMAGPKPLPFPHRRSAACNLPMRRSGC